MSWFKVDDHFWGHPKRLGCSLAEIGLWTVAGSWSAQQLTDGKVPRHVLSVLGGRPKDAAALVAAGLWIATDDGWLFHDWTTYQPTRATVMEKRDAEAQRKKDWRDKKAARRAADANVPAGHDADGRVSPASVDASVPPLSRPASALPDPTRPDPDRSSLREEHEPQTLLAVPASQRPAPTARNETHDGPSAPHKAAQTASRPPGLLGPTPDLERPAKPCPATRGTRIPDTWPLSDEHRERLRAWGAEHTPAVELRSETENWQDWHRAKGDTAKDWTASWRTWMRRAQKDRESRPAGRPVGRVAEGDAILAEAFTRGQAERRGLSA